MKIYFLHFVFMWCSFSFDYKQQVSTVTCKGGGGGAQWANIGVDVEIVISEYIEITFE